MSLGLDLEPERAFMRHRVSAPIASLPGFVRGRHRLPRGRGRAAENFVHELGAPALADEVQAIYDASKRLLGLRRRQLSRALAAGGGNVDAPQFNYAIELGLDPEDEARALWQRRVMLLVGPRSLPESFDSLFPVAANELVIPFAAPGTEVSAEERFDDLVERLEDFAELHGGTVHEDESEGRASLLTTDGSQLTLDLGVGELSLTILGVEGCRALLLKAERRFEALAAPIVAGLEA